MTAAVIAPDLVRTAARRFPGRPAMIAAPELDGDAATARVLTFGDVDRRADHWAAVLAARGVAAGDRVALLAGNEVEYLELQVGCQRAGVVLVPLNTRLAVSELAFIVSDAGCRLVVAGPDQAAPAAALGLEVLALGPDYEAALAGADAAAVGHPGLAADAPACILYTSGTTGRPKGAVLSNLALYARAAAHGIELAITPDDVFVQTLPMFHIASNLSYGFTFCGAANVMVKAFDPELVVTTIERLGATRVLLVPTTIQRCAEHPGTTRERLASLRTVLYGASPIAPEVLARALAVFGCDFLQFFGMTETSGCTLLRPADHDPVRHPERLASAGTETVSFEVRVVGPDDEELPTGEVGEIVCRGPAVMSGYWGRPDATAEALRGGWMHTGDLGRRDADGYLYVTDRLKDMVVTGGENVYPREVEDVLYAHPAVAEAAVIGVPDERWGERVHAVVVVRDGVDVDDGTLLAHCRAHLAGYKCPKTLERVAQLPRNVTGKVLKTELRAQHWAGRDRHVG